MGCYQCLCSLTLLLTSSTCPIRGYSLGRIESIFWYSLQCLWLSLEKCNGPPQFMEDEFYFGSMVEITYTRLPSTEGLPHAIHWSLAPGNIFKAMEGLCSWSRVAQLICSWREELQQSTTSGSLLHTELGVATVVCQLPKPVALRVYNRRFYGR